MSKKNLVILGTGGTIAGVAESPLHNVSYQAAQLDVADLLAKIPMSIGAHAGFTWFTEQVFQIDSKDMVFKHWVVLAQRVLHHLQNDAVSGVVITHGTDTLEETAFFLYRVLPADLLAIKPVVITCAMRPATSLLFDGTQNIQDALTVAATEGARGVLVACAGVLHSALWVQKIHTYKLDAFDSGDAGALGVIEEGSLRLHYQWPEPANAALPAYDLHILHTLAWPRVEIVLNYVGADGAIVHMLCAASSEPQSVVKGLIVAGTGNGTLSQSLQAALLQYQSVGIRVQRCTRCAYGRLQSDATNPSPIEVSGFASPVKARIDLMLALMYGASSV